MRRSQNALRAMASAAAALVGCSMLVTSGSAGERLVQLDKRPQVADGLAAIPRIAAPADAAEQKINAAVARLDAKARKAKDDCRIHKFKEGGQTGDEVDADKGEEGSWERTVRVPMRGPRFISYVVTDEVYCGGNHPNAATMSIVYDLTTGRSVDWDKLLPPSLTGKLELVTGEDGTQMVTLSGRRLHALYTKLYRPKGEDETECREMVSADNDDGTPPHMMAWLDAQQAALVVYFDLAHAVQACAEEVAIPVSVLKAEGVKPLLIDAIDAAHRAAPSSRR